MRPSSAYKSIAKGAALFGGVQVFSLLVNLLRGKFVALLLGTEGMGVASLLTAAANTIQQFSSLGLNLSIVKEVSQAREAADDTALRTVMRAAHRLLRLTACLGALFALLFAVPLSRWTFGTPDYAWHFAGLSVFVLLTTLSNGELSILQGVHALKKLALASVVGSLTGLLVGVPLYYFFGQAGIVPAMVALALSLWVFYAWQRRKAVAQAETGPTRPLRPVARRMVSLGLAMMASALLGTLATYLFTAFVGRSGSLQDVGLIQAAQSITTQYSGLVFAAIAMDFMPRLSAISLHASRMRRLVNQQTELMVLAVAPLVLAVMLTAPWIIRVLLTEAFLPLVPVVRVMAAGIFFKAITFPMGYISFAKGDKRTFFWLEGVGSNVLYLGLNCLGYHYGGIVGVGLAFALTHFLYIGIYVVVTRRLYRFRHNRVGARLCLCLSLPVLAGLGLGFLSDAWLSYGLLAVLTAGTAAFCVRELDARLGLWHLLKQKLKARTS